MSQNMYIHIVEIFFSIKEMDGKRYSSFGGCNPEIGVCFEACSMNILETAQPLSRHRILTIYILQRRNTCAKFKAAMAWC